MRILVATMNHIGDVLFTTPALAALQNGLPDAQIWVLGGARSLGVLEANPHLEKLLVRPTAWRAKRQLIKELRAQKFDLSLNFSSRSIELALISCLAGAPIRWGHQNRRTRQFFTRTFPRPTDCSAVEEHLALALAAGGQENGLVPRIYLTDEEQNWAAQEWESAALIGEKIIGLHVGASYAENSWRPEKLIAFSQLAKQNGARCIAFGGPNETPIGARLAKESEILDWTGRHDLRQFFALVNRCAAFVGGDSGPTHCAAALNVPTVGLYGFSNPARTGVRGERVRILGEGGNWDKKAQKKADSPYQWLDAISPEMAWTALEEMGFLELRS